MYLHKHCVDLFQKLMYLYKHCVYLVSCVIWEGNECKKVDLTALDIGWAIIDKVDSLPESSDYFLIGLLFSIIMACVSVQASSYVIRIFFLHYMIIILKKICVAAILVVMPPVSGYLMCIGGLKLCKSTMLVMF